MCQNLDLQFLHFIAFCQVFFRALFSLFWLSVLLSFLLFFIWFFIALCFPFIFRSCFVHFFCSCGFISSLPNLLENKRLGWCCCCNLRSANSKLRNASCIGSKSRKSCFVMSQRWMPTKGHMWWPWEHKFQRKKSPCLVLEVAGMEMGIAVLD
jgi:hypothetical protein